MTFSHDTPETREHICAVLFGSQRRYRDDSFRDSVVPVIKLHYFKLHRTHGTREIELRPDRKSIYAQKLYNSWEIRSMLRQTFRTHELWVVLNSGSIIS